ncbi:MAG: hypothetical protein B7Y98_06360 [Sphingomonas sp. 32-62-10]|nr:MAG: hypothetical protein B7Y98_06360 [Sphingomonas sp. 32-62-10]
MADSRETGLLLDPKYNTDGLITAVVTDRVSGDVLMVAHMNAEALAATQTTGEATFWSRSRGALWKKGETSGNILRVAEIRIDCDQDSVWVIGIGSTPYLRCPKGDQRHFPVWAADALRLFGRDVRATACHRHNGARSGDRRDCRRRDR